MHRKTVTPSQKEAALLQSLLTQTLLIFFPNYHFKGRTFFFFARKDRMRWKLSLEDSTTKQLMEASCLLGLAHGITTSTATTSSLPKSLRVGLPACQITIFHVFYFSFLKANHLSAPGTSCLHTVQLFSRDLRASGLFYSTLLGLSMLLQPNWAGFQRRTE